MGAQKSIHAGKAKIDVNVDFTHKLCASLMLPSLRSSGSPLSLIIGSLCIKHPNLFGGSEKLDVSWDKGLYDSNVLVAYRKPRPEWLAQKSFVIQHSLSPEIGVHGIPVDNFSRSGSGGVNLSRLSVGLDLNEPASSRWSSTTSIKFEHVRPVSDEGRSISRDLDGLPLTCSGSHHDSMVVLKQESRFAKANDCSFSHVSLQIEQGIPVLSKWLIFNRFKFAASKGIRLGPAFLLTRLKGGSIVGDMAPYQAFSIGGLGSVRGYGEGAVGSGRSCLIANSELTLPLNKMLEGAFFLDCGTDLGSGHLVPGNPALRQGKPGSGIGIGYGLRFKSQFGQFQVDYAINAFHQRTVYFGISNVAS
ncbi:outer envelope protein 80, chloroplastic [Quillaja saponaria]|uniref:Outer envelope protein 80, chloroplastic n=1 Tax=Quillaja saponaria TaxID=32244 RepID=A0AAD7PAV0_QUISA|nr:outer envelope protein 80, chloroplastic [Quillaja saponaria]KAJ7948075.1 outer envelope protein 80, chloroplastic [Quillaja saponaria]